MLHFLCVLVRFPLNLSPAFLSPVPNPRQSPHLSSFLKLLSPEQDAQCSSKPPHVAEPSQLCSGQAPAASAETQWEIALLCRLSTRSLYLGVGSCRGSGQPLSLPGSSGTGCVPSWDPLVLLLQLLLWSRDGSGSRALCLRETWCLKLRVVLWALGKQASIGKDKQMSSSGFF